jgi:hypothetical protein
MEKTRTIGLYGNSIIVSSVAASLERQSHWQVVRLGNVPLAQIQCDSLNALVFDLSTTNPTTLISLLSEYSQMLLLGVDLETGRMLVLSSQLSNALTTQDLIDVIENYTAAKSPQSAFHGDAILVAE